MKGEGAQRRDFERRWTSECGWSEGRNETATAARLSTLTARCDKGRIQDSASAAGTAGRDLYGRRNARNR